MMYADTSRGYPFSKDPAVVRFQQRYYLYYSLPPHPDRLASGWGIGIAVSSDLENWTKSGELTGSARYEDKGFCAPGAVVLPDGPGGAARVHLFYQTYGNGPKDAICHAWSDDGLNFTRDASNPVFHPTGDWNAGRAIDADVIAHDGQLFLFFATRDPAMQVQMLGVASAPLGSGFGRADWVQRCQAPILRPELPWEQDCIEAPAVCARDGHFYLFYGGAYNNAPQQVGCAVSDDLLAWRRISDQPFLPNGALGSWNACKSGHPFVFTDEDGQSSLFFQGNQDMGKSWYLSRVKLGWSPDGPAIIP